MNDQPVTPENDRLLLQEELASRWQVTTRCLQNMRKSGKGPKHIFIGSVRYLLSEIVRYEQEQLSEGVIASKVRALEDPKMASIREQIGKKKKVEAQ